ncbi:B2 protein-like isoform X2 [Anoplophora glabripennis]|uniref:B2 protein-like isoform X2 n=1 Tax=Anoplophora glabripennis TaxID=217634 RepID=UPI000875A71E|nr:B2 protein-like isoform X2 [Anoplophora glabripennis]
MKTCIAFICVATLVVSIHCASEEQHERVKKIHSECQADPKTHADDELLKKYHKGEEVDKSIVGAHMLCMSTKFGVIQEDGKINKSALKTSLSRLISDETKLNEAIEKCAVEKDDPKDTALALGKCFREQGGLRGHEHIHNRL